LDKGSSSRKARGSRTSARPIATRWRCPPDSAAGLRAMSSSNPSMRAISATRRSISSRGARRWRSPNARFWRTVMCG
jgi:hypothetical protein